jgi:hypothetical protein
VEKLMQATVRMVFLVTGIGAIGIMGASASLAAPGGNLTHATADLETLVQPAQYWRGSYCDRLRRACVYKEERGEVGEGTAVAIVRSAAGSATASVCGGPASTRSTGARSVRATAAAIAASAAGIDATSTI